MALPVSREIHSRPAMRRQIRNVAGLLAIAHATVIFAPCGLAAAASLSGVLVVVALVQAVRMRAE
jgi:hypothetical protein